MLPNQLSRKPLWVRMDEDYENIQFLLKYAPKFYTKVEYNFSELRDGRVFQKAQRMKIVKVANVLGYKPRKKNFVKRCFRAQHHTIKSINVDEYSVQKYFQRVFSMILKINCLVSWKCFLQSLSIEKLTLTFPNISLSRIAETSTNKALNYLGWRFWSHLKNLKKLNTINFQIYNDFGKVFRDYFGNLNNHTSLLSSLKSLSVFLSHMDLSAFNLSLYTNLFKFTTNLQIHEFSFTSLQLFLDRLHLFENLTSLTIMKTVVHINESEDPSCLLGFQSLQSLSKLTTIDITLNMSIFAHFKTFLQSFSPPQSTVSIKLSFNEIIWQKFFPENIVPKPSPSSIFTNSDFTQFYSKWTNLPSLDLLSFCFAESECCSAFTFSFILPVLQNLTTLRSFCHTCWQNNTPKLKKPLDIAQLWKSLSHLRSTLEKVYIETPFFSLQNFDSSVVLPGESTNLKELTFSGTILGSSNLGNILKIYPKNSELVSTFRLEMEAVLIENEECFISFLECLRCVPRTLNFALSADMKKIPWEFFTQELEKFIGSFHRANSLILCFKNVVLPTVEGSGNAFFEILSRNRVFKNLMILDKAEVSLFNYGEAFRNNILKTREELSNKILEDHLFENLGSNCESGDMNEGEESSGEDFGFGENSESLDEENGEVENGIYDEEI